MTGHGFRGLAATALRELGFGRDVVERQMAHAERNPVTAACVHAEHLPERRRMMQVWGDHLDRVKSRTEVIHIASARQPINVVHAICTLPLAATMEVGLSRSGASRTAARFSLAADEWRCHNRPHSKKNQTFNDEHDLVVWIAKR